MLAIEITFKKENMCNNNTLCLFVGFMENSAVYMLYRSKSCVQSLISVALFVRLFNIC